MPRDITLLKARFKTSNNKEKTQLFKTVIDEILRDIYSGRISSRSNDNIIETLEVFQYINGASSEIMEFTRNTVENLSEMQRDNPQTYDTQTGAINILLNFLASPVYEFRSPNITREVIDSTTTTSLVNHTSESKIYSGVSSPYYKDEGSI